MESSTAIRFRLDCPTDVPSVYDTLAAEIDKDCIIGIQEYGAGRTEVLLSSKEPAEILFEKGFTFKGKLHNVSIYGDKRKWIHVKGLPFKMSDESLKTEMENFGKVYKIVKEKRSDIPSLLSGMRKVLLLPQTDVPSCLSIEGVKCILYGQPVKKACWGCCSLDHLKTACPMIAKTAGKGVDIKVKTPVKPPVETGKETVAASTPYASQVSEQRATSGATKRNNSERSFLAALSTIRLPKKVEKPKGVIFEELDNNSIEDLLENVHVLRPREDEFPKYKPPPKNTGKKGGGDRRKR